MRFQPAQSNVGDKKLDVAQKQDRAFDSDDGAAKVIIRVECRLVCCSKLDQH